MGGYSVKRAAMLLMVATAVEKILGFGREMAIAGRFGATSRTDSYIAGYLIPNFIMVLLNAGLVNVYAPLFISELKLGEREAWEKINSISTYLMLILLIVIACGMVLSPYIVKALYPGFDGVRREATVSISRLFYLGVFIYCGAIIEGSILNCYRQFIYPTVSIALLSGGTIISVLAFGRISDINSIAYGYIGGASAALILQHIKIKRIGGRLKANLTPHREFGGKFLRLLFPVLVSTSMSQANVFVDRIFASYLREGSMSYLTYADRIIGIPIVFFSGIITTVIFPDLIEYASNDDMKRLRIYFNRSLVIMLAFLIPSCVGLDALSREVVGLIFQRSMFDAAASANTASALVYYSPTIVITGGIAVLAKVYYSLKDTKTLMYVGIATILMNVVLDYLLMKPMLHNGLALATSIVALVQFIATYFLLQRRTGISDGAYLLRNLIKISASSAVLGAVIFAMKTSIDFRSGLTEVLAPGTVGAAVYFALLVALRVDGIDSAIDRLKRKNRRA